ncbi:M15 family metallopeptidase [Poritiphilus flavus]|uniref:D-alanyl-D-alanine dipeptidase n=1 Tax=Poritiphilus flavus TaxID=2697053 RepID=A0A6L9ECJ1_9FLAO|nr:M15 family metallopeptidase [Poritiphilus flavus]NAS12331.1 peptidase M15 [Poritiphilus flavus]
MNNIRILLILLLIAACKDHKRSQINESENMPEAQEIKAPLPDDKPVLRSFEGLADTTFVRLADFSEDFLYDMRYATENNFLKAKVYDCPECYTRVMTAKALIAANKDFMKKGYKIKFFDCYRPNSVQYKMWEIVPNPQYVADPVKGSIHNKGGAVDITLATLDGVDLDMGTDFDFFGKRAYHDNMDLPREILDNRKLLKEGMESHGFWGIRTEWWHYNLTASSNQKIADFKWECK